MMKKSLLLALVVFLMIASPVMAKEGFYIGAFYPIEEISVDAGGAGTGSGGGWGFRAGMGFNRYFAVEAHYSTTSHNSADLKTLAADLKVNFPLTTLDSAQVMSLEPYAMLGYAHNELSGGSASTKSDGVQYGVGIELYLFKELSVHAGYTRSEVSFDTTPKAEGNIKTMDVGLVYHFI
jgi:hypothetical protein